MSVVYPAAYVLFEKMRLRDGKPKSDHRVNMERVWGKRGGVPLDHPQNSIWTGPGESVHVDQCGDIHISRR